MDAVSRGLTWTGIERVGSYALRFLIGLVMARLLVPSDYGLIGMVGFFLALGDVFRDCGFQSALVQKKGRTDVDYATAFWFNLALSLMLFVLFFGGAPAIAVYYGTDELVPIMRALAAGFVMNALSSIQFTRLTVEMRFGVQSAISLVALVISGGVGVSLAWRGWGAWALVGQTLIDGGMRAVLVWYVSGWIPRMVFSGESFRGLFRFGSKILCSSTINSVYMNLYSLVIGKNFGPVDVGYFNRADGFAGIPPVALTDTVIKVNYPVLSELQDDDRKLREAYRRLIRRSLFWLVPILCGMVVLAVPMVRVLVGEKWVPCVPYLQVLCFAMVWHPLTHINLNLLYVKGRADLVLRLEVIKKPLGFLILFASIPFGVLWMCIGRALYNFISYCFDSYYTGKFLGYGLWKQMIDLVPMIALGIGMGGVVWMVVGGVESSLAKLVIGSCVGAGIYLGVGCICYNTANDEARFHHHSGS